MTNTLRRRPRAGFTLVEVMLALLIVGFMMVAVTQILSAARQTRDVIHNIQERQLAGPAILARVDADLRALTTFDRDSRYALRVRNRVVDGFDADSLDFVTTVNSLLPFAESANVDFRRADVNEVGYRLRPNPNSDDFLEIYRREGFGVDEDPFEGGRYALLHDRIKGFNVFVYAEDGPEAEPEESWGTADDQFVGLPARIEMELTIELAPRLIREQLITDRRTVLYRRIFRFPESQRLALEVNPVPVIPVLTPPIDPTTAGPTGAGGPDGGDGGSGDDGRGGDEGMSGDGGILKGGS